jgi:hypothetical protein
MLREQGNEAIKRADERLRERDEERANKRQRQAVVNQGNGDRGGVEMRDDNQEQQEQQQEQQGQQQQDQQMEEQQGQQQQDQQMEESIGSISVVNQIVDMTEWNFSDKQAMQKAQDVIKGRKARAIILSTAMGVKEFGNQCSAKDPHEVGRQSMSRTIKAVKCAKEQDKRGLYFVLEEVIGGDNEVCEVTDNLINQQGIEVSNPYSIMYREGNFGWVTVKVRAITNSIAVRDNLNKTIAGKCWMKTSDNRRIVEVVERAVKQESEMTIMGVDNEAFAAEESEARQYWDDLSGKSLDPKLVR